MTAPTARVSRAAEYLCDGVAPLPGSDIGAQLTSWLSASTRFFAFAEANRDKIRKKLRTAVEPGARGDVVAELATAFHLLADRRIDLTFEAYGSGLRGPDFTVTFRTSHRFNIEVTRPRLRSTGADAAEAVAGGLLGKLRQLPPAASNAVLLAAPLVASPAELGGAIRALKLRADGGDDEYFRRRGLSLREFQVLHRRMSLLMAGSSGGAGIHLWQNPESRRPLPEGAATACQRALASMDWA